MTPGRRKQLWLLVQSLLALAILVGVARYFSRVLSDEALNRQSLTVRIELLIPAGLLYLLAHCCWGSFWVRLLWEQGIPVTLYTGLRSYFVSQLGKYVPGKAWVIVMRVGMLGAPGTKLAVGMTATYETLTNMAAGTLLGIAFLPYLGVLPPIVSANLGWLVGLAALPLLLAVLNKLAARVAAAARSGCASSPKPLAASARAGPLARRVRVVSSRVKPRARDSGGGARTAGLERDELSRRPGRGGAGLRSGFRGAGSARRARRPRTGFAARPDPAIRRESG